MRQVLTAVLLLLVVGPATAHEFKSGELTIGHPFTYPTPDGATVGAGYLTIRNAGAAPDRLVSIESPVSARVEIHTMTSDDGIMRMRMLADGLAIPASGEVALSSGGTHLMFLELKVPLVVGTDIPGTLVFEHAGRVPVVFTVEARGATPSGASEHGQKDGKFR